MSDIQFHDAQQLAESIVQEENDSQSDSFQEFQMWRELLGGQDLSMMRGPRHTAHPRISMAASNDSARFFRDLVLGLGCVVGVAALSLFGLVGSVVFWLALSDVGRETEIATTRPVTPLVWSKETIRVDDAEPVRIDWALSQPTVDEVVSETLTLTEPIVSGKANGSEERESVSEPFWSGPWSFNEHPPAVVSESFDEGAVAPGVETLESVQREIAPTLEEVSRVVELQRQHFELTRDLDPIGEEDIAPAIVEMSSPELFSAADEEADGQTLTLDFRLGLNAASAAQGGSPSDGGALLTVLDAALEAAERADRIIETEERFAIDGNEYARERDHAENIGGGIGSVAGGYTVGMVGESVGTVTGEVLGAVGAEAVFGGGSEAGAQFGAAIGATIGRAAGEVVGQVAGEMLGESAGGATIDWLWSDDEAAPPSIYDLTLPEATESSDFGVWDSPPPLFETEENESNGGWQFEEQSDGWPFESAPSGLGFWDFE